MKEGRPSKTALFVAFAIIMLGRTECDLLPSDILSVQAALLEAVELPWIDHFFLVLLQSRNGIAISWLYRWLFSVACKDSMECLAFRKSFMENQVRQFLETHKTTNKKQVLILGAGYDTLSLRLSKEFPHVNFWEIDHPATGNFKNRLWDQERSMKLLQMIGGKPINLYHASVDLTNKNELSEVLGKNRNNYDVSSPTIVLLEGLLMYFTKSQVLSIFDEISKAVGKDSVAAFDMLATKYTNNQQRADLGFFTAVAELYVKVKDEPWLLGMDAAILKEFVASTDWSMSSNIQVFGPGRFASVRLAKDK